MNILYVPGLLGRTLEISDQDTTGAGYHYYGFITPDGAWIIMREDVQVENIINFRYAAVTNNTAYPSYSAAWTARASLNYNYFNLVTP